MCSQRLPWWSVQCGQEPVKAIKRWHIAIANCPGDIIDGCIAQSAAGRFQKSGCFARRANRPCTQHRVHPVRTVHPAMRLLPSVMMIELSDGVAGTRCLQVADIPGTLEWKVVEAKPVGLRGPAGGGRPKQTCAAPVATAGTGHALDKISVCHQSKITKANRLLFSTTGATLPAGMLPRMPE